MLLLRAASPQARPCSKGFFFAGANAGEQLDPFRAGDSALIEIGAHARIVQAARPTVANTPLRLHGLPVPPRGQAIRPQGDALPCPTFRFVFRQEVGHTREQASDRRIGRSGALAAAFGLGMEELIAAANGLG